MRLWIAKQRYLIDFTLASLARRKTKNIGLVLVFSLLVFALASVTLLTSALRQEATRVLAHSPEVLLQRMVAGRHDLIPPGYIERIGRRAASVRDAHDHGTAAAATPLHFDGIGISCRCYAAPDNCPGIRHNCLICRLVPSSRIGAHREWPCNDCCGSRRQSHGMRRRVARTAVRIGYRHRINTGAGGTQQLSCSDYYMIAIPPFVAHEARGCA